MAVATFNTPSSGNVTFEASDVATMHYSRWWVTREALGGHGRDQTVLQQCRLHREQSRQTQRGAAEHLSRSRRPARPRARNYDRPVGGVLQYPGWVYIARGAGVSEARTYTVPGMHCANCERAVRDEVGRVAGVEAVDVDLETKVVTVRGRELSDETLRAAIYDAGYEVA
jgi:copper chaperone CopZ